MGFLVCLVMSVDAPKATEELVPLVQAETNIEYGLGKKCLGIWVEYSRRKVACKLSALTTSITWFMFLDNPYRVNLERW